MSPGWGEVIGNEGVFGLQRAFRIAGADVLMISLWPVSDRATNEFMTTFYRYWVTEDQSLAEAFRSAQTDMRHRFLAPYYIGRGLFFCSKPCSCKIIPSFYDVIVEVDPGQSCGQSEPIPCG